MRLDPSQHASVARRDEEHVVECGLGVDVDEGNPGAVGRPATVGDVAVGDRPDHLSGLVRHFERSQAVPPALSEQLRAVGRPLAAAVEVTLPLAARLEDPGQERQPSPVASEEYDAAIRVERELLRQRDFRRTRARVRRPRRRDWSASALERCRGTSRGHPRLRRRRELRPPGTCDGDDAFLASPLRSAPRRGLRSLRVRAACCREPGCGGEGGRGGAAMLMRATRSRLS